MKDLGLRTDLNGLLDILRSGGVELVDGFEELMGGKVGGSPQPESLEDHACRMGEDWHDGG